MKCLSYKSGHDTCIIYQAFINTRFQVSMQINQVLFYNKRKQTRNEKDIGIAIKSKETSSYVAIYLSNCTNSSQCCL